MESISIDEREVLLDKLGNVRKAILDLKDWNKNIDDLHELLTSQSGMQALAGNCMLILAIGESFIKIDKITNGELLPLRSEIPWRAVFGMRNRIAHGYFDIDTDFVNFVIKKDLDPLLEATEFFIEFVENLAIED